MGFRCRGCDGRCNDPAAELHPIARWVLACRNEDGGFGSFPGDISGLRSTAWALEALCDLKVKIPRADQVADFVFSHQNEDGGFHGRPWGLRWTDKSTLADSFYALRVLQTTGKPVPRPRALIEFVKSRQREDGAFRQDLYPETAGVCAETFYAVSILRALDARIPNREDVIGFLGGMQADSVRRDGGFIGEDTPDWKQLVEAARKWAGSVRPYRDPGPEDTQAVPVAVGYTRATYFAASALSVLGSRPPDPEGAVAFLCNQQHPAGGFVTGMGDYGAYHDRSQGRMSDTYHALSGLRLLVGERDDQAWSGFLCSGRIDAARCAAWIEACWNPEGGFARRPDPLSRPSDMASTAQAVRALELLGRSLPGPAEAVSPNREKLPAGAEFKLSSPFFQPDQPGQALYLHRIVAPIRAARRGDEATAIELMRWVNQHFVFGENSRNEAALIIEDGFAACGPQARCLAGLLEAAGIPARFLMVKGHCTAEGLLNGRWCLLDAEFDGAFRRPDGQLYSALDIHERHRLGKPEVTTFGDWRYESYTIYWPRGGGEYREIAIRPNDTADSTAARQAYPELSP